MSDGVTTAVERGLRTRVTRSSAIHGGDVAQSFRIELDGGRVVFAKTQRDAPPGAFSTEASDLEWLRDAAAVAVPAVLLVSDGDPANDVPNHLVLEWIEEGRSGVSSAAVEAELGRALAALHRAGAPCFGRLDGATTGSLALPNDPDGSWPTFYARERLVPLNRLAHDAGALPDDVVAAIDRVAARIDRLAGPAEPPARLHGDLWAGNRLVDVSDRSWLIDPSSYGGHREVDLAMMRLFGGFGSACFAAYHEAFPLDDGWSDRVGLYQLAPLVVHAIKFGGSYVRGVRSALRGLV
jgi:fructosamine-3-kinase